MKKRKLLLTALCLTSVSAFAFGFTACKNDKPNEEPHTHNWSAWTVSEANEPTGTTEGKATRTCTGTGDCDAEATDKEYTLPVLTSADYSKSADTATCSAAGVITYTYNKNGINLSFDITTSVNAEAHNYGSYIYTDGTGHYKVCGNNAEHKTGVEAHNTTGTDGACSVCGYKAPVSHAHTPSETWVNTDPEQHYKLCTDTDCDNPTEKLEADAHNTNGTDGACSVCGYKAPASHTHTPSETWVNTDPEQHYKLCTDTDCDNPTEKLEADAHNTGGTDGACSVCGYKATPSHTIHTWGDWTVTTEPTKVMPGKATRTCIYDGCSEVDTEVLDLPPLASTLEYTITNDTASCTEGGTATYMFTDDNDNTVSFTAATEAKGHSYGEVSIVNGVPKSICGVCQEELEAPMNGTITPSQKQATFFAGGDLEYTLTANSGALGYYIFTYEGEKEITVEYNYYTFIGGGEVSDTVTLSVSGRTAIIAFLETRATCVMKITSTEETAFIGEISLEFSDRDPSYVVPELSIGLTTVSATYMGTIYEFTAPVNGMYTLSCESEDAVIILDGTAEILELPYIFTLEKYATISFVMSCEDETAEYDVQVALGLSGSGTYSDPYLITENFLAVNIGATVKNGETKYYKIAMSGEFFINCLPVEAGGTYPAFVSDDYTSEVYSAEITVLDEKIIVTGWKVTGIVSNDGFLFALTGSGSDVTDNVQLFFNSTYGSEKNHYDWVSTYFYMDYKYYSNYKVGDTVYIDFAPTVSSRVTLNFAHISTVIYDGKTMTTDGSPFEMFVVEGETYTFVCTTSYLVNGAELRKTKALVTNLDNGSVDVTLPATSGIDIEENVLFTWWTFSEGSEAVPFKITGNGEVELFANGSTFVTVAENQYVTFNFGSGITAKLNGNPIASSVRYSLTTEDSVEFVNGGTEVSVSYTVAGSLGIESNPYIIAENTEGDIGVYASENYFVRARGDFELVLTFSGVTITRGGKSITSGAEFRANDGDIFVIENSGNTVATVSYKAAAILGSKNNPKELVPETAEEVTEETYFTVTITGDGNYQIVISDPVSEKIMAYGLTNGMIIEASEDEYAVYGVIVQYNDFYYAFDANGVLCEVEKHTDNTNGRTQSVTTGLYNNGENANAYVAKKENIPLYLTEGTHILHVLKNSGDAAYLEDLSIGCTLTLENASVKKYTVDFVTNKDGVTVDPQLIEVGGTATMVTPECEGYVFYAWYTDAECTNKFDFSTKIGKDTTLYASWVATDGLKDNPLTAVEGENSGKIYALSEFKVGSYYYYHYYEYTVTKDCDLKISIVKGSRVAVHFTLTSFEDLEVSEKYTMISDGAKKYEETITVNAGDKLYLNVCNLNVGRNGVEYGNYAFTITVVTTVTPPDVPHPTTGSGTEEDPYIAVAGTISGTSLEDGYVQAYDAYFKYYKYTATADGTLTFTCTADDKTTIYVSKTSYAVALDPKNDCYLDGEEPDCLECTLEVSAGDTVYIVAGTWYAVGAYSFTMTVN